MPIARRARGKQRAETYAPERSESGWPEAIAKGLPRGLSWPPGLEGGGGGVGGG